MYKVAIDPGHAPGNANRGPNGYREYAGMWKLSIFLKEYLAKEGITAILTRRESENPSLWARGNKAHGANLFISQHTNGFNGKVRGVECFYSTFLPETQKTAAKLSKAVSALMGNPDRGAKVKTTANGQDYFGVIRSAAAAGCPMVFLMESGFHDNPEDEAFLLKSQNLIKIAEAQAKVIINALESQGKEETLTTQLACEIADQEARPSGWAATAWKWGKENGITDGTNPRNSITREQVIQLLFNYNRLKEG